MGKIKKYLTKQNIIIMLLMLIATSLSSLFLFSKINYEGVDTQYHLSRIIGITNSWKSGDFFAFIHLDQSGYGYAMGFFYSNFFMILPCIIYLCGVNIFVTYKIFIFIIGLITSISMYICIKSITKSKYAATISMFLYTTCSYRIITMFAKAFLGELVSFIFIPIIILGLYKLIFDDENKWWIFALGFIGILNSNLVMTEIMIVVSLFIILFNSNKFLKEKSRLVNLIKATIFSLLITAVFWMPMIEQLNKSTFMMNENMKLYKPTKWLIEFKDLFFGTIQYKNNLAAAYGLGLIFIFIIPFRIKIKKQNNITKLCDISILIGLLSLIMMTNLFPWKYLEYIGETIQFPSRLEILISAFFSMACGIICSYIPKKKIKIIIFIMIFIWQSIASVVVFNSCIETLKKHYNLQTKEELNIKDDFKYNICDGVYLPQGAKYSEAQLNSKLNKDKDIIIYTNNNNIEYNCSKNNLTMEIQFSNNNERETYIEIPMYYYYGYICTSLNDSSNYTIEKGEKGLIKIYLEDKKQDTIKIYYKITNIQIISTLITGITILFIIYYIIIKKKKTNYKSIK